MAQKTFPCTGQLQDTSRSSCCTERSKRRQANGLSYGGAFAESSRHLRPNAIVAAGGPAPIRRRREETSGNRPCCCKTFHYLDKVRYLKRGNRVKSSLAILPIVVRLPLVPQCTSAAGTIYWSQTRFTRVQRHSYSSSPTKACVGTGMGKCIRECKRGVAESVNVWSTVMDINLGGDCHR